MSIIRSAIFCYFLIIMKSTPVICGIDLGSWTFKLSVFSGDNFQILTNQANFRETPSLVGYTPTQRLLGQPALIKFKTNYNNTIRAPHRLLGLQRHQHLLEEELKYAKLKYTCEKDLIFSVQSKEGDTRVMAEQVLISLIAKAKQIIESHQLYLTLAFIAVPTYYGQEERFALKKSAQVALGKPVRIIDDWLCLGAHYAYTRLKQLKTLQQMRNVIFLDVGYSKCSLSLVQFTQHEGRLLDWEHLPYTGLKNMDNSISQFYNELFNSKHHQIIFNHPKAYVKLLDAVQKQRTVLSANSQYHFNLEYLLAEEDLTYNMTRQEFQDIIVSVLSDIAASMASFQSRNCGISIHSIELMGGGSRIPCIQSMTAKIFGLQPSRTLNQSESIAIGSTIFGALERKLLNMPYYFSSICARQIRAKWKGQKSQLFHPKTVVPNQKILNVGTEGPVDMSIYIEQSLIQKQIAYLNFKGPSKLTFLLDQNKILTVKGSPQPLTLCQLHHKTQQQWSEIRLREEQMKKLDNRMVMIYQMKNDFESKFYWCKNKLEELKDQATKDEVEEISKHIEKAEKWVEEQHHHHSGGSQKDLKKFQQKIQEINYLKSMCEQLQTRGNKMQDLKARYNKFTEELSSALLQPLNEKSQERVIQIMTWGQEAYQAMENSNWKGDDLTVQKIEQARTDLKGLKKK